MASHYVVALKTERLALPEYAQFQGLRCEIQVQTVLNHAWAETAHDIIYKGPTSAGFGRRLTETINKKMRSIMEDYLIPAGDEIQNVLHDSNVLRHGMEMFDRGALKSIQNCQDNNERYDLLDRFGEYVLPNYDDLGAVVADVRRTAINAAQDARDTEPKPVKTGAWDFPGKTSDEVLEKAIEIIDYLRYFVVTETLSALSELYLGARSDEGRNAILASVERLADNKIDVWEQVGNQVQLDLMLQIEELSEADRDAVRPVIRTVCKSTLDPVVQGTSSTYKTVTFSSGAVQVSESLVAARTKAIKELKWQFQQTSDGADVNGGAK